MSAMGLRQEGGGSLQSTGRPPCPGLSAPGGAESAHLEVPGPTQGPARSAARQVCWGGRMGVWMSECGAPSDAENWFLCKKALEERQARKHPMPECLGGQTGCGRPGRNPVPQSEGKAKGRKEERC